MRAFDVILYPIGDSGQKVLISDHVLQHVLAHRQLSRRQTEAGGQLFADFRGSEIHVLQATGPRPTDRRTRYSYHPDRAAEQAEIVKFHAAGLHFIGDWHSHPDQRPQPSGEDLASMADCVRRSNHRLGGFLLLIVGQRNPPDGLSLTVHDGDRSYRLAATDE